MPIMWKSWLTYYTTKPKRFNKLNTLEKMSILIYADTSNGALTKNAFEAVSYGAQLAQKTGGSATAIVTGSASGLEELGKYGASKVIHVADASLDQFDPQKVTAVMAEVAGSVGAKTLIFSHDFAGKSVLKISVLK